MDGINYLHCFICQKHTKEGVVHPRHGSGATVQSVVSIFKQFLEQYQDLKKTGKKEKIDQNYHRVFHLSVIKVNFCYGGFYGTRPLLLESVILNSNVFVTF